jgi:drug/metabolite transporter (DMT)-like permease
MSQLVAGAVMISFSAVFVRLVHVAPTVSAFYRMFFGSIIILAAMAWRREKPSVSARNFLVLALAAVFFAFDLGLWHRSILYVGPGVATLLANFQVFVLAAVGVGFFKEKLTLYQWAAIGLAMLGLILLVGSGWDKLSAQYHIGVVLGLLTAVAYAGYILTLRSARTVEGGSSYTVVAVVSLITALILAASVGAEGDSFMIPSWSDAGWLFLYGLVPQVLGWVLISNAMARGVGAAQVGLVLLLQPTCAFIWDWLFFGRHFSGPEMAGAGLALVSIYMGSLKGPPFQKKSA